MAEGSDVVRQKVPAPLCVPVNGFSGRVIAYSTGAIQGKAKTDSKTAAETARRAPMRENENLACPNCAQPGGTASPKRYGGPLMAAQVNPDTLEWVAYHWAGWRSTLDCQNRQQYESPNPAENVKLIEYPVDVVCPGRRVLTGCVVAMAIAADQTEAHRAASAKAKQRADQRIGEHRQTACPNGCTRSVTGDTASTPVKLEPHHEIPQARQGAVATGAPRVVSYYAATWQVQIACTPASDDDEGEGGEMFRGERSRDG